MPVSFVKSLEQETSNEIKSEGHVTEAVQTELSRGSSNDSLASIIENTEDELLDNEQPPLNARCHSCDDILSASTHSPVTVPKVTVSLSQNTATGILETSVSDESGTLKRASSDTMINSTESSLEGRLTKFTGKLFHNLLRVGKSLKHRTSPIKHAVQTDDLEPQIRTETETETKDTNEDSDSSLPKLPKRLRFRKNVFKTASGQSTAQNDALEEEVTKKKKRAQSKSKIIIV